MRRLLPLLVTLGCAGTEPGVQSVHIALELMDPLDTEMLDEMLEVDSASEFTTASGDVDIDVVLDAGTVMVMGLPDLPDGFVYTPMLEFVAGERDGLDGDGHDDEGTAAHGHSAGHDDDSGHGGSVMLPMMMKMDGMWMLEFSSADLGEYAPGACRSATVHVSAMSGEGMTPMVMMGEADVSAPDAATEDEDDHGGAGHSHGV